MTYCAFTDPGQVGDVTGVATDMEAGMPQLQLARGSWLYPCPIRRYDRWCKWLQNAIGLMNHRVYHACDMVAEPPCVQTAIVGK